MEKEPQGGIRKALVITLDHLGRQIDGDTIFFFAPLFENGLTLRIADRRTVAAPADPDAAGTLEQGIHRRGEAAGAFLACPAAAATRERHRQPVRDDDQPAYLAARFVSLFRPLVLHKIFKIPINIGTKHSFALFMGFIQYANRLTD